MAKTTKFYSFTVWYIKCLTQSHWAKIKLSRDAFFPRGSQKEFVFLPFPASKGCLNSLAYSPIFHLQSHHGCSSLTIFHSHFSLWFWTLPPSSTFKHPDCIRLTWFIQCTELWAQQLKRPCLVWLQKNKEVCAAGARWRREAGRMGADAVKPSGHDVRPL